MFDLATLKLQRYPRNEQLQAWNSADRLLLERWQTLQGEAESTWVVNDDFGALTVVTGAAQSWSDSWLAHHAIIRNWTVQQMPEQPALVAGSDHPGGPCRIILMKVPKQQAAFIQQLKVLRSVIPQPVTLLCAGMDKHLSRHTAQWIESCAGDTQRHRGQFKARLFEARLEPDNTPLEESVRQLLIPGFPQPLTTLPGVFSSEQLDGGTRLMLEQLASFPVADNACDLACGNGVLGLALLNAGKAARMTFADESALALLCARRNLATLFPDRSSTDRFYWGDGLAGDSEKYELIICNPPFHQGHVMDAHFGKRLLRQCAEHITAQGHLFVVANRHLPYQGLLKRHFKQVSIAAQNNKYQLWHVAAPVNSP